MDINATAEYLEPTGPSQFLKSQFWFVPVLQTIHILAVCLLLTGFVLLALRAWGLAGKDWSWPQWSRLLKPLIVGGFAALLGTGLLQVMAEPTRELPNWIFQLKMTLIVIGIPLAAMLLKGFSAGEPRTGAASTASRVRLLSAVVAPATLVIIIAGRWIAYI